MTSSLSSRSRMALLALVLIVPAVLWFGGTSGTPGMQAQGRSTITPPPTPIGGAPTAEYTSDPFEFPTLPASFWTATVSLPSFPEGTPTMPLAPVATPTP